MKILIIGEVAAHVFIPKNINDSELELICKNEGLIQIGGVGLMIKQFDKLGVKVQLISKLGSDLIGNFLGQKLSTLCDINISMKKKTSIVYIDIDKNDNEKIKIVSSKENKSFDCDLDKIITSNPLEYIAYCPFFPGYEEICKKLIDKNIKTIIDFGYYKWKNDFNIIKEKIYESPSNVFLGLISGENLKYEEKKIIESKLKEKFYENCIITSGAKELVGYDSHGEFKFNVSKSNKICSIGAGDIFISGVIYELYKENNVRAGISTGLKLANKKIKKLGI